MAEGFFNFHKEVLLVGTKLKKYIFDVVKKIFVFILMVMVVTVCVSPIHVQAARASYSLIFDAQYYSARYTDLQLAYGNNASGLLSHFIRCGMKEGRQGNEDFNVNAYKNRYDDLRKSFGEDLVAYYMHYMNYGYNEGRTGRIDGGTPQAVTNNNPINTMPITEESVYSYYDKSVFIGDSLMVGFRNYELRNTSAYANRADFLAVGSYSLIHALRPVSQDDLQPSYQGNKMNVWDAVAIMDVDKVFMLFGTNDIGLRNRSLEKVCSDYALLIEKIREVNPDVEIHIISMTPVYEGVSKSNLNHDGVINYNILLEQLAEESGCGYMDIYSALAGEDGYLKPGYCSDSYVHHTNKAYSEGWNPVLYDYAVSQLQEY